MKKLVLFGLVALLAIGLSAPPARAVTTFPAGEYTASITDRSSLFSEAGDNDAFLEPEGQGDSVDVGDEQRSIIKIDAINTGNKVLDLTDGTKFVAESGGSIAYTNGLLTGMIYDLEVSRIVNQNTGDVGGPIVPPATGTTDPYTLEKGHAGRYSSAGGPDGQWTDTVGPAVSDLTASGVSYAGLLVIYEDPALNLSFAGDGVGAVGPNDWKVPGENGTASPHPGAGVMGVPGVLTNADYFPTISDVAGSNTAVADSGTATPWLVAVLVDLADIPAHTEGGVLYPANPFGVADGTYMKESNFVLGANGSVDFDGLGFANIIGGTAAHMFNLGNFSIFSDDGSVSWLADLRIEFEGENSGQLLDGWQIDSDDPAMFGVVPEPATMSLLGLSLVGLAGIGLRRKKD
ncbi:MAG: PEP-CTERM sorting domain-containing protein [Planctomycetota bacterium]